MPFDFMRTRFTWTGHDRTSKCTPSSFGVRGHTADILWPFAPDGNDGSTVGQRNETAACCFGWNFQAALKIFDRVAPALQITGHSFRRGALQALIDAGYTASQVREVSQHKTDTALFDYLQELPHDLQDRVEDLQAAVQRVSTRPRA